MTLTAGALRAEPRFRRYLAARAISTAGTLVTAVVLPVLVYRLTWSVAWTAAVVVLQALPHLLLTPVAAAAATRLNRRKLLFATDLAGGALLTSLPLAWWYEALSAWHVLAVAGAVQVVHLFLDAAHRHTLPDLVGTDRIRAGGVALRNSTGLAELMVPPLAGLAVAVVAPAPLLALDALSFVGSALLVRAALRGGPGTDDGTRAPGPGRVRQGLRLLRRHARSLALAGMLNAAAAAAFLAVLLPWANDRLGVPPYGDARLALVVSCWGLGVIGGRALSGSLVAHSGPARLARTGVLASLLCALAVVLSAHWVPALLGCLAWGAAHTVASKGMSGALEHVGVSRLTRPATRLIWHGAGPALGAALAGGVAVWSGPRAGLAVSVGLLAMAAVAMATFAARRGTPPGADEPVRPGTDPTSSAAPGRRSLPSTLADRAGHGNTSHNRRPPRTSVT